ncbi:Ig-like domain-containing protein [Primorskyibacter sp. 2E107]|uniref:Ig-like domain-containing protein n=1 Tax=Primorskyibacter sp. 2E107 TaxID=3403458 RepID=UPI003AF93A44
MADLFLNWGALGAYGTNLDDGASVAVDTGGVEVGVTFNAADPYASAFTYSAEGYVADGEDLNPNSFLKMFDDANDDGVPSTASTTLTFTATDTDSFTDEVQAVSFRINDLDFSSLNGDMDNIGAGDFEDIVTVNAYDAEGNLVPVTLTPAGAVATSGQTATGTTEGTFTDASGSLLVTIDQPVHSIEIIYENGGTVQQAVTVSDVHFTTVDVDGNTAPDAVDDTETTSVDTAVVVQVQGNDSDPEGDTLTTTSATDPANGSVVVNPDGTITYTPDAGFMGTDTFDYTIDDGNGGTDTATVTVVVDNGTNTPPVAFDDTETTGVATPVTLDPTLNDLDAEDSTDDLSVLSIGTPANGTAVLNADGTVTYTPNAGFTGTDSFTYELRDTGGLGDQGTITVTVTDANTAPDAVDDAGTTTVGTPVTLTVLGNDTDPEGDTLSTTSATDPANGSVAVNPDGTITYTPDAGFTGTDTFDYTIDDGNGGTDAATVTVTVSDDAPNDPPVAVDDTPTTEVGTPVTLDPTENDSDPNGDPVVCVAIGTPTNGTATLNPDGTVTYVPDPTFIGEDTIPYTIDDGNGGTDTAEIIVTVTPADPGRIDTDIFPVDPSLQDDDPFNGLDEDPDPSDDLDSVDGTAGVDVINTGDDNDTINAGAGNDVVNPGIDNDLVTLGDGNDILVDPQGADTIFGGAGDDTIIAGVNTFSNYEGDDPFFPTLGFTSDPNTEDGRDYVEGNTGNDSIETGDDDDTIDGGQGDDTVDGGIDDDLITGNQGNDSLLGGHGSDTIDGGQDDDYIDGSAPAALELTDDIDVNTENDRDSLIGALGNDTIFGGDDDDTLLGGSGNDYLDGGIDEDSINGGGDDDTLIGGQGGDTLNGGAGDDSISGGADRDVIVVDSAADGIGDTVDGGAEGDDYDILDLSGVGVRGEDWRIVDTSPDSNGNGIDGTVEFLNADGDVTGTMDFFEIEEVVPCFTPGTLIATPQGERLVEDLEPGDRVITRDNGIQAIKWVGRKDLTGFDLARKPHFKPILIQKGVLGNNLPEHDMLVSPNHRILVANDKTALYFEEREVLVAAKHLTGLDGVDEVESLGVSYIHVMFENHEVILSNGAWTESFQPGDYTLKGIGTAQLEEIFELFPELEQAEGLEAYGAARRSLKKHEAQLLTK